MENIVLKDFGNFYVRGHEVILRGQPVQKFVCQDGSEQTFDPNGQYEAGQMYVEYARMVSPASLR